MDIKLIEWKVRIALILMIIITIVTEVFWSAVALVIYAHTMHELWIALVQARHTNPAIFAHSKRCYDGYNLN